MKRSFIRLYRITVLVSLVGLFFVHSLPVAAITNNDLKSIISKTPFYDPNADSSCAAASISVGSGAADSPFFPKVSDTAGLAQKINDYIKSTVPKSPMATTGDDFVTLGQKYNVNPIMGVMVAQVETSFGTTGNGRPPKYDFYNERSSKTPGGWRIFPNYTDAIDHYYQLMSGSLYLGPPSNFTTVDQVINRTSPPTDGNQTSDYVKVVKSGMTKILGGATSSDTNATQATATLCGSAVTTAGALGWDMSGPHAIVNYDQTDPKWANHPYGAGKSPIGESGCGPTSLAMVGATLLGDPTITPVTIADRYGAQYHTDGTAWGELPAFAKDYNLQYKDLGLNWQAAADTLRSGGLVVITVGPGYFTSQGHFMVLRAVTPDGGSFYIADPNGKGKHGDSETRSFSIEFLSSTGQATHLWGFNK